MAQQEIWDILDENRSATGKTVARGSAMKKNDYHLIIHSWIKNKSNNKFLISKRKDDIFWGGFWQPTGGSAKANESSKNAAIREVYEELGVNLDNVDANLLFSYRFTAEKPDSVSFFLDSWLFEVENDKFDVKCQIEEVSDFAWVTIDELFCLWQNKKFMPFEETWVLYFSVLKKTIFSAKTISSVKFWGTEELKLSNSTTPSLDANLLLCHLLKCQKDFLLVHGNDLINNDINISNELIIEYQKLLLRRIKGEPIAYITQKKDFWAHTFFVDKNVLIPKPDTELLVENAINLIKQKIMQNEEKLSIADVCTGSGCIIISVLKEIFEFCKKNGKNVPTFFATDISIDVLNVAKKNAENLLNNEEMQNLFFLQGDLLTVFDKPLDVILTNPPYVPTEIATNLLKDGRKEPLLALDGGSDGLFLIKKLVPQAWNVLNNNGIILIESGEYNAKETADLCTNVGFVDVQTFFDLGGMPRLTTATKNELHRTCSTGY